MYKIPKKIISSIKKNTSKEGESIERMFERMMNNNESDLTTKEMLYFRPELGVPYGTDIRQDKFDKALETTDKVTEYIRKKRDKKYEERKEALENLKKKDKNEGVQATSENSEGKAQ